MPPALCAHSPLEMHTNHACSTPQAQTGSQPQGGAPHRAAPCQPRSLVASQPASARGGGRKAFLSPSQEPGSSRPPGSCRAPLCAQLLRRQEVLPRFRATDTLPRRGKTEVSHWGGRILPAQLPWAADNGVAHPHPPLTYLNPEPALPPPLFTRSSSYKQHPRGPEHCAKASTGHQLPPTPNPKQPPSTSPLPLPARLPSAEGKVNPAWQETDHTQDAPQLHTSRDSGAPGQASPPSRRAPQRLPDTQPRVRATAWRGRSRAPTHLQSPSTPTLCRNRQRSSNLGQETPGKQALLNHNHSAGAGGGSITQSWRVQEWSCLTQGQAMGKAGHAPPDGGGLSA